MDVQELVARLTGVRVTTRDAWMARCPAHGDRSPSLCVKGLPDGRILLHCFAGCDTAQILAKLGLTLADLFPERLAGGPRVRPAFSAIEALRALARESGVVAIVASDLSCGRSISPQDASRVCAAAGRIASALELVHGR